MKFNRILTHITIKLSNTCIDACRFDTWNIKTRPVSVTLDSLQFMIVPWVYSGDRSRRTDQDRKFESRRDRMHEETNNIDSMIYSLSLVTHCPSNARDTSIASSSSNDLTRFSRLSMRPRRSARCRDIQPSKPPIDTSKNSSDRSPTRSPSALAACGASTANPNAPACRVRMSPTAHFDDFLERVQLVKNSFVALREAMKPSGPHPITPAIAVTASATPDGITGRV